VPGNRTWDLRIFSQELWPLDHRGGHSILDTKYEKDITITKYDTGFSIALYDLNRSQQHDEILCITLWQMETLFNPTRHNFWMYFHEVYSFLQDLFRSKSRGSVCVEWKMPDLSFHSFPANDEAIWQTFQPTGRYPHQSSQLAYPGGQNRSSVQKNSLKTWLDFNAVLHHRNTGMVAVGLTGNRTDRHRLRKKNSL
jgi:hypothetical protein